MRASSRIRYRVPCRQRPTLSIPINIIDVNNTATRQLHNKHDLISSIVSITMRSSSPTRASLLHLHSHPVLLLLAAATKSLACLCDAGERTTHADPGTAPASLPTAEHTHTAGDRARPSSIPSLPSIGISHSGESKQPFSLSSPRAFSSPRFTRPLLRRTVQNC